MKKVIAKAQNWKAPGPDKIQNFWYKRLPATHPMILKLINKCIHEPDSIP